MQHQVESAHHDMHFISFISVQIQKSGKNNISSFEIHDALWYEKTFISSSNH